MRCIRLADRVREMCWYTRAPTQLTNEERVAIAKRVSDKAAGRVPVVAGG